MGDHSLGMDTGVCSAGTVQIDRFSGHQLEPLLDLALNGAAVALALPATEFCAVIADNQFDIARVGSHRHGM